MTEQQDKTARDMICNFSAIRHASRHMTRYYDSRLAALGLRSNQFSILRIIFHNDAITVNALAKLTVMDRTTVGHAIQPLLRDGLIVAEVDPKDRRSRLLRLSPAGKKLAEDGQPIWLEAQQTFESKFGAESAKTMRATMSQVIATELNGAER